MCNLNVTGDLVPMRGRGVHNGCILGLDLLRVWWGARPGQRLSNTPWREDCAACSPLVRPATAAVSACISETAAYPPGELQTEEEEWLSLIIWSKNCDGLTPQQQESVWQELLEFKDIFALKESDVGLTDMVTPAMLNLLKYPPATFPSGGCGQKDGWDDEDRHH